MFRMGCMPTRNLICVQPILRGELLSLMHWSNLFLATILTTILYSWLVVGLRAKRIKISISRLHGFLIQTILFQLTMLGEIGMVVFSRNQSRPSRSLLLVTKKIFGNIYRNKHQLEAKIKGVHMELDYSVSYRIEWPQNN